MGLPGKSGGMSTLLSSEITREGCTLRFWLTGSVERPLIVFTHGAAIDHREWRDTLPLVAQDYRVLYWDVRGHGHVPSRTANM